VTDLIPAAPGWYVEETDDSETCLDPIIAWKPGLGSDGDDILMPFVDGGPGCLPFALTEESFAYFARRVVYRPNHDPDESPTPKNGATQ
jgi:hypothetical protein